MIMLAWFMRWRLAFAQVGAILPALAVAGVTGYASWGHIVHVGLTVQEPSAALLPVAVDGMVLAGAFFALVDRLRGFEPRGWAVICMWLGSALTLTFNILSAVQRGWAAMLISAVFAVTFLATVEAAFHPSHIALGASSRAIKRAARLARKVMRARRGMPSESAVESFPGTMEPTPAPVAPALTQAVEPVAEPVPTPARSKPPRARRAPNATTEHQRPERGNGGRGRRGKAPVVTVEAVADDVVSVPDAMGLDAMEPAASDATEPVAV